MEDTFGELTNLLAGRVQASFARFGQVVTITPPIVVRGVTIEICSSENAPRAEVVREAGNQRLAAWLDYQCTGDPQPRETTAWAVDRGQSLFF